ncbi:MAG: ComEC/Rec2 family competence protein [Alistipes sp.]|nr:ComEC/Rec2 family competence protein [Alistipes sp.]
MYLSRENITNRIKEIPMAIVMLLFALGISFAEYISLPMWLCITIVLFSLVGALFVRGAWQRLAVAILVVSLGVTLHSLSYTGAVPYNRPMDMTLKITRSTTLRGDYAGAEATICECEEPSLVGRKVVVWSDTLTAFTARDYISLRQKISPFREERRAYAELMHHRGFVGAITIYPQQHFTLIPARYTSLHDWATERLREQMPAGDARAVVLAMVTGYRGEISSALRERYALSGASHLLAVSGLHIGIVFMLINILLLPMLLLTYGNVARSVVAVLLIWLYVLLCGAPPSAIRAAVMFSLLQIALSTPYRYLSLNILAGTALVMTMFDTHLLFDISFQLSFLAVAGILLWAVPASRLLKTPYRIVNGVVAVLLVGVASTVATLPIVSENFGVVSLVGVIINPIVIVLANILVVLGAITMLIPIPIVASVVEWVAHLQNVLVEWAQSLPWGHFEYKMSEWLVWLIYLVFVGITIFVWSIKRERRSEIADY